MGDDGASDYIDNPRTGGDPLFEEIRNHDPMPAAHEREWMEMDHFASALRVLAYVLISTAVGVSVAVWNEPEADMATVAQTQAQ
jgi:hypothetical protein